MAKLIYIALMSLDGYIADKHQLPVSRQTGHVAPSTNMDDYPVYQELVVSVAEI